MVLGGCRSFLLLVATSCHCSNYLGALWVGGERAFFMLSNLRDVTQPSCL